MSMNLEEDPSKFPFTQIYQMLEKSLFSPDTPLLDKQSVKKNLNLGTEGMKSAAHTESAYDKDGGRSEHDESVVIVGKGEPEVQITNLEAPRGDGLDKNNAQKQDIDFQSLQMESQRGAVNDMTEAFGQSANVDIYKDQEGTKIMTSNLNKEKMWGDQRTESISYFGQNSSLGTENQSLNERILYPSVIELGFNTYISSVRDSFSEFFKPIYLRLIKEVTGLELYFGRNRAFFKKFNSCKRSLEVIELKIEQFQDMYQPETFHNTFREAQLALFKLQYRLLKLQHEIKQVNSFHQNNLDGCNRLLLKKSKDQVRRQVKSFFIENQPNQLCLVLKGQPVHWGYMHERLMILLSRVIPLWEWYQLDQSTEQLVLGYKEKGEAKEAEKALAHITSHGGIFRRFLNFIGRCKKQKAECSGQTGEAMQSCGSTPTKLVDSSKIFTNSGAKAASLKSMRIQSMKFDENVHDSPKGGTDQFLLGPTGVSSRNREQVQNDGSQDHEVEEMNRSLLSKQNFVRNAPSPLVENPQVSPSNNQLLSSEGGQKGSNEGTLSK